MPKLSWRYLLTGCCGGDQQKRLLINPNKPDIKQATFQKLSSELRNSTGLLSPDDLSISLVGSNLYVFTLSELKVATQSFSTSHFLGEGGFGPVYKGFIDDKVKPGLKAQAVAVKILDLEGAQGHKEWLAEVVYLGQLRHPHLVKLIGYCCEDEQRLLVYEFMAKGSLENHLFKRLSTSLSWSTRLKIAVGAAKGLAFLHEAEQPVIYRDFKASNILLDSDYKAKLSDFGLAKDGPVGEDTHVSTRVMGTQGYAAPEYIMTGHLTVKSDVYSFGVVLLELLTGRRSIDNDRPNKEQNLVDWARPCLNDTRKLKRLMDPNLDGEYSVYGALKAADVAYECLSENAKSRPHISTIVETLQSLLKLEDPIVTPIVYNVTQGNDHEEQLRKGEAKESNHHHAGHRLKLSSSKPRNRRGTTLSREVESRLYKSSPLNMMQN